jgi:hypothetical protein
MNKMRISEDFTTLSTDFIRVATLEELKTARMIVVRGAGTLGAARLSSLVSRRGREQTPRRLDQWISELSFGTALKITSAPLREPRCDGCKSGEGVRLGCL